jgi:hypothetical protein
MTLAPGERSDVHRHDHDYILVFLEGDRIAVEPEPDSAGPYKERLDVPVQLGTAVFVPRGGIETAVNTGRLPYRELLIELKDGPENR